MTSARSSDTTYPAGTGRTPIQTLTLVMGVVFLLVGVLGFVPGVTTHYDQLQFAGHNSMAKLVGLFMVSVLHNVIHLAYGVAGLVMARSFAASRAYLIGGGVIYAVVWLYGLLTDQSSQANFVPLNTPDNWLHFVLAVVMIGAGLALGRRRAAVGEVR